MKNTVKWIWFAEKCGAGSSEMVKIYEKYGSINAIYLADYNSYIENDVSERLAEKLADKSLSAACSIIKYCEDNRVGILTYACDEYPRSLRSIKDPPAVLYYLGRLPDLNKNLCIATVGTRKMSEYGMRSAYKIAYEIASSGAIIVSGMALGIDSVAASAALKAGGKTVAVLGSGIDIIYPKEHKKLYREIAKSGVVITEYPPSTEPSSFNFPMRNRIISGLSQGTVVIDAGEKSGALITSKTAILQGRDVFAVPSNIDSENSSGTNSLIRDGAQAVLCGYDVVKNYAYLFRDTINVQRLRMAEERSELDEKALAYYGVRARGARPAFEGISAKLEKERAEALAEGKPKAVPALSTNKDTEATEKRSASDAHVDNSKEILESLDDYERKIFEEMPLDRAVSADYFAANGENLARAMFALTTLEIKGLVSSLPGALYIRK